MAALRVLPDYRDELVAERTATASRIHIDLAWSRPGYQLELPALTKAKQLRAALTLIEADEGMRARVTRQRLRPMLEITEEPGQLLREAIALLAAAPGCLEARLAREEGEKFP